MAKAAGVGTGTAYRHFPTQEALVEATYRDEIARLETAAGELLRDHPPDEALALWLHRCIDYLATQRGLSEAMRAVVASGAAVHADSRAVIVAALNQLLDAAQAAGTVRTDIDALDVAAALGGIYLTSDPARAHRVLAVFIAGLRTLTPLRGQTPQVPFRSRFAAQAGFRGRAATKPELRGQTP